MQRNQLIEEDIGSKDHPSIKLESDFMISKMLQKHGVSVNDSVDIAKDSNLLVRFLQDEDNVDKKSW